MNLNYAIFRSEPIYTLNDLAQIGSHNKREKKAYNSNPNIKIELSSNNIYLVPLTDKYVKGFYNKTIEYKKEHEEKMKTERTDRKRTFKEMVDKSKNVVADELLFTATNEFFKDMNEEDIKLWANTCMEIVYKDLGYKKEQVLHSTIHLDEKTPHIHCVVIPLVKKYDKRTNTERYTISKKQYIKDKIHLSELQDKYHKRLTDKGFDLERGIKGSDNVNLKIKEYKRITRKLNNELNTKNQRLNKSMEFFEEKMKTTKNAPFNKTHLLIEKETFNAMNDVIKESKRVMEVQPKIGQVYDEINNYTKSYRNLEKQNKSIQKEVYYLNKKNEELEKENRGLKDRLEAILEAIKRFFREILLFGNEKSKEATVTKIKDYYDNDDFTKRDVIDIAEDTTKENELFDYVDYEKTYDYDFSFDNTDYKKNHSKDDGFSL